MSSENGQTITPKDVLAELQARQLLREQEARTDAQLVSTFLLSAIEQRDQPMVDVWTQIHDALNHNQSLLGIHLDERVADRTIDGQHTLNTRPPTLLMPNVPIVLPERIVRYENGHIPTAEEAQEELFAQYPAVRELFETSEYWYFPEGKNGEAYLTNGEIKHLIVDNISGEPKLSSFLDPFLSDARKSYQERYGRILGKFYGKRIYYTREEALLFLYKIHNLSDDRRAQFALTTDPTYTPPLRKKKRPKL